MVKGQENLLQEKQNSVYFFFAIAALFFVATAFVLFIKRTREALIPIILSGVTIGLIFMGSNVNSGDCGDGAVEGAKFAAAIALVCFLAQFTTWLLFRKKRHAELS
ncbi:MAG TPA: hypothetical protein VGC97_08980 [Pyrinomonadaceae bacterium]